MSSPQESLSVVSAQDALFEGDFGPLPDDLAFRGPVACNVAGISYRQLDYWARTGLVTPEIRDAGGSGTQRLYSFRDILMLKVVKRLLDAGISLQQIRTAIDHLRERGVQDLSQVTLMSDGISVYECTTHRPGWGLARHRRYSAGTARRANRCGRGGADGRRAVPPPSAAGGQLIFHSTGR